MEEKRCKFCDKDDEFNTNLITQALMANGATLATGEVYIQYGNQLKLYFSNSNDYPCGEKKITINYCPICGRKLEPTVKDVMDEIYDTNPEEYDRIMNKLSGGGEDA